MATTVTYIEGYEVMPLCGKTSESIQFNEFEADLSDGYYHQAFYGADTGTKTWNLSFASLPGASASLDIDLDGTLTTKAAYLWDLFCRSKRTGQPFVIESKRNDQYYLARFADSQLSFERMLTKLFSTGVNFKQVRVSGVSVFDTSKLSFWAHWNARDITGLAHNATINTWADSSGNNRDLTSVTANMDTIIHNKYLTNQQNTHPVVSLNNTGGVNTMYVSEALVVKQVIILMKMREAAFSSDSGIISASDAGEAVLLLGDSAETKFFNIGFSASQNYKYEKNSVEYAESNQQAPMNAFGLVYLNFPEGVSISDLQIGKDRAAVNRDALMDVAELFITDDDGEILDSEVRELAEHLGTVWNYA